MADCKGIVPRPKLAVETNVRKFSYVGPATAPVYLR